ncbi:glutathione binding-like protein [Sphingomonas sp.]|uniref:glutathione binding-like protein n=1 Tax=Sphingomonas sp. TaxID=28214 RepID=UPI0025D10EE1|nr:glutathione binding-like protein [Sphingomonas sp.]
MIELHSWPTPNGLKISLFLEDAGVENTIFPVNIGKGEQFDPPFLKISPNNRIPAIIDTAPADGGAPITLFESGAILLYLAEKTGQFLSRDIRQRTTTLEWLFWQVGGLGPMAGQNGHFNVYAPEKVPYAIERYVNETKRLYGVLDKQLDGRDYVAGDYSIADMAIYPWIVPHENHKQNLADHPHLKRWFDRVGARPAVLKVYAGKEAAYGARTTPMTDEERAILFGSRPK